MRIFHKLIHEKKGQATVEFALIFALLVLPFLIGVLEVGWLFYGRITLNSMVREGVRAAAVPPLEYNQIPGFNIEDYVMGVANNYDFSDLTILDVDVSGFTNNLEPNVTVLVTAKMEPLLGVIAGDGKLIGADKLIWEASAVMRKE
ncbi:TadE/TadG family type IV pilus assembly protein [Gudongella sp. DL1XJH-153]|uniref:TadE/TadG family type IV pilus assembly protein n=1 Tax=Gudongella sp. DL1XJH-153 TaxID=3409804 RepID=UPI003BB62336